MNGSTLLYSYEGFCSNAASVEGFTVDDLCMHNYVDDLCMYNYLTSLGKFGTNSTSTLAHTELIQKKFLSQGKFCSPNLL